VPAPSPYVAPTLTEIFGLLPQLVEAVESESLDPEARLRLGTAQFSVGRFDAAVEQLSKAVELDSSRVSAWIALGRAAFYSGNEALSAKAYWNVIRLDPEALDPNGLDRVILDAVLNRELHTDESDAPHTGDAPTPDR